MQELILLLHIPKHINMQIKTNHVHGSDLGPLNCTPKGREGDAEADHFLFIASSDNIKKKLLNRSYSQGKWTAN